VALRVCVRRPATPAAANAATATIQTAGMNFFEPDDLDTTVLPGVKLFKGETLKGEALTLEP